MLTVILIQPENPGNIGAVARAMANFDCKDLVLIDPKCKPHARTAWQRAKHASPILKNAKIRTMAAVKRFDVIVGTTAKLGTDYNIGRSPVTPRQLAEMLPRGCRKVGLVFGRESNGLTNEEIRMCDFVVTIPSSKKSGAMNLSHAVAILLYELHPLQGKPFVGDHITLASAKEKEVIMRYLDQVLARMVFAKESKRDTQRRVWRRMISKSFLSQREAASLMGFLRKVQKDL